MFINSMEFHSYFSPIDKNPSDESQARDEEEDAARTFDSSAHLEEEFPPTSPFRFEFLWIPPASLSSTPFVVFFD